MLYDSCKEYFNAGDKNGMYRSSWLVTEEMGYRKLGEIFVKKCHGSVQHKNACPNITL